MPVAVTPIVLPIVPNSSKQLASLQVPCSPYSVPTNDNSAVSVNRHEASFIPKKRILKAQLKEDTDFRVLETDPFKVGG